MQLAIFGGSFDPLHIAHEEVVNSALESLDIDLLIVVPTFLNPFKKSSHLDPDIRLSLLEKNFEDNKNIYISDYEILQNKPVYSYETIKFLKKFYKAEKIYLIIGSDNYKTFSLWHKSKEILKLVEIVVATRDGFLNKDYDNIQTLKVDIDISSTQLRDNLNLNYIPEKIKNDVKKYWH